MAITDQIKILDRKVMQNEAQYDLDRKAAKISALSSNNLDKYEHLTGKDFGLKPSTIEQAKFEYSPLGKVFIKRLDKDDLEERLLKRLKNIEKAQKKLIIGNNDNDVDDDDDESIYSTPQFDKKKKKQYKHKNTKCL